jgi:uncharacterized membrane protein YraQ (UPF0718 family)
MFNWLDFIVGYLVGLFIDPSTHLFEMVHFFFYDVIKIMILLAVMIFIISYIRSYFSPERSKQLLGHVKGLKGNIMGSLLGIVTPFCSCSSVPIFVGMVSGGVPLGVTFSFLITSPMVNEAAFIILLSTFGVKVAALYVILGVAVGVIGGYIIEKLHLEHLVEDFVYKIQADSEFIPTRTRQEKFEFAKNETKEIFTKVYKWVIIGVLFGALIHGFAPENFLYKIAGPNNPFAVIVATIVAVPLYSNTMGMIPVASALIDKGMALGTAMSFMMATTALSLPEMMILRKVIKPRLIYIFVGITTAGIMTVGFIFNLL